MRLIDADKCPCKECMSEFHCNNTYCAEFEEWLQKPVYDIDKVVEDLEEKKIHHIMLADYENKCGGTIVERQGHLKAIEALIDAIEIVKKGLKEQR